MGSTSIDRFRYFILKKPVEGGLFYYKCAPVQLVVVEKVVICKSMRLVNQKCKDTTWTATLNSCTILQGRICKFVFTWILYFCWNGDIYLSVGRVTMTRVEIRRYTKLETHNKTNLRWVMASADSTQFTLETILKSSKLVPSNFSGELSISVYFTYYRILLTMIPCMEMYIIKWWAKFVLMIYFAKD